MSFHFALFFFKIKSIFYTVHSVRGWITCLPSSCKKAVVELAAICRLWFAHSQATWGIQLWELSDEEEIAEAHAWNFIKSTLCFHLPEMQLFLISGLPMNELYSASINLGSFHLCSEIVGPEIREWAWLCNYTLYFIFHPGPKWKRKPISDSKSHYRRQGIYDTCLRWSEEIGHCQESVSVQLRFGGEIWERYRREVIDGGSQSGEK